MKRCSLVLLMVVSCFTSIYAQEINETTSDYDQENIPFLEYDPVVKARLDNASVYMSFPYNALVHEAITKYEPRKVEMGNMLGLAIYYFPLFQQALKTYNLPDELKYLPVIESSLNPLAISVSGAAGLWQFMPATGKGYGLHITAFEDQRHDPYLSSYAAVTYLKDLYSEFGDWWLTLAAYNCGAGTVRRAMHKHNVDNYWDLRPFLPLQAQQYIPKFIATVYTLKNAENLGIALRESYLAAELDSIVIHSNISFSALSATLNIPEQVIADLNPIYRKKMIQGSSDNSKKVLLPKISLDKYDSMYELLNTKEVPTLVYNKKQSASSGVSNTQTVNPSIHKVVKGENLSRIAIKYSISVQELKNFNSLKKDALTVGQILKIPSSKDIASLASR